MLRTFLAERARKVTLPVRRQLPVFPLKPDRPCIRARNPATAPVKAGWLSPPNQPPDRWMERAPSPVGPVRPGVHGDGTT